MSNPFTMSDVYEALVEKFGKDEALARFHPFLHNHTWPRHQIAEYAVRVVGHVHTMGKDPDDAADEAVLVAKALIERIEREYYSLTTNPPPL